MKGSVPAAKGEKTLVVLAWCSPKIFDAPLRKKAQVERTARFDLKLELENNGRTSYDDTFVQRCDIMFDGPII